MKKPSAVVVPIVIGLVWAAQPVQAQPAAATLQNRGQERTQWCWNGASEMVLDWRASTNWSQTDLAAWAVGGNNIPNYLDANSIGPFRGDSGSSYFQRGVRQVLRAFGPVPSQRLDSPLSWEEVKAELDAERPFLYALSWIGADGSGSGGHVGVAKDYAEGPNLMTIEDPWPANKTPAPGNPGVSIAVPYSIVLGDKTTTYKQFVFGGSGLNEWVETLVLGRSLDIVFVIDTTGSMGSYISNVQSQAQDLIDELRTLFDDVRVAVVEYRDIRSDGFNARAVQAFTSNLLAAKASINTLRASGGGDTPEAVFTAVYDTAKGVGVGAWRTDKSVSRQIILMGDAPGHDPEPWPNPRTIRNAIDELKNNDISLQAVHVGSDDSALFDFTAMAGESSGRIVSAGSSAEVASLIKDAFIDIETGRFPVGSTIESKPTFLYEAPGGRAGGVSEIRKLGMRLETFNEKRGRWRSYRKFNLKDLAATSFAAPKDLPPGKYRWRLAGSLRPRNQELPDGSAELAGQKGKFVEENYVEFERVANAPRSIRKITKENLVAEGKTQVLEFRDDPLAEAFAVRVTTAASPTAKPKKRTFIFKRAKTTAGEQPQTLKVTIRTKPGAAFFWEIQGLNFDRKKIDDKAWN
jgi:hypothetical protein